MSSTQKDIFQMQNGSFLRVSVFFPFQIVKFVIMNNLQRSYSGHSQLLTLLIQSKLQITHVTLAVCICLRYVLGRHLQSYTHEYYGCVSEESRDDGKRDSGSSQIQKNSAKTRFMSLSRKNKTNICTKSIVVQEKITEINNCVQYIIPIVMLL